MRVGVLACVLAVACRREPIAAPAVVTMFAHGATATSPLVIALHGMGGSPERFARLWADYPATVEIALPRGPYADGDGFAWFAWPPGLDDDALADAIAAAEARLWPELVALAHGRPLVICGFSQGGVLAYAIAARHPDRVTAAFPISGRLPDRLARAPAAPIYALHGAADEIIEVARARQTVAAFRAAGATAELHEFPATGHTISAAMRDELFARVGAIAR